MSRLDPMRAAEDVPEPEPNGTAADGWRRVWAALAIFNELGGEATRAAVAREMLLRHGASQLATARALARAVDRGWALGTGRHGGGRGPVLRLTPEGRLMAARWRVHGRGGAPAA